MLCKYLQSLHDGLQEAGIKETFRGEVWPNTNEWVYFDAVLDIKSLREQHQIPSFVRHQDYEGTHDGHESGFYCGKCKMGVMGVHPDHSKGHVVISRTK